MRPAVIIFLAIVVSSAVLVAQTTPSQPAQPPAQQPQVWLGQPAQAQSSLPPSQTVITIKGVCGGVMNEGAAPAGGACETQITREQFERLVAAVNSNNQPVTSEVRRSLGQGLGELLVWADAAIKAGVDKDPGYQDMMRIVRIRTLRDFYLRKLEEQARNVSPQDLQAYYDQNLSKYQEIKLQRVFIPGSSPGGPGDSTFYERARQIANTLQQRAAAGEDFTVLQKDAYGQLGIATATPNVDAGTRRPGMTMPDEEKQLFAMQPGQVSKVFTPTSGFVIYKVVSKQALPLDQVKDEVTRELYRSRVEAKIKEINAAAHPELNEEYFGPPGAPARPAPTLGPAR